MSCLKQKQGRPEMYTGMLWFDNSQSSLAQKIKRAVDYYEKKYGRRPDLCLVHPSMLLPDPVVGEGMPITVRPYRPVLPGHLWIGVEEISVLAEGDSHAKDPS